MLLVKPTVIITVYDIVRIFLLHLICVNLLELRIDPITLMGSL